MGMTANYKSISPQVALLGPCLGYGPAKFLTVAETVECSAALNKISDADFLTRYRSDEWDARVTKFCLGYFQA